MNMLFLDNCVHGDSLKPFPDNATCKELVDKRPSRCYTREYRQFCCGSCNTKFTGKKGKLSIAGFFLALTLKLLLLTPIFIIYLQFNINIFSQVVNMVIR